MPRPSPITPAQELEIVELYKTGVSRNKLAILYGAARDTISSCVRRHGVETRSITQASFRLPLHHDAFASPETNPEAAYWTGFLMADGCISESVNGTCAPHLILVLSTKDVAHIESFRSFLESRHSIQLVKASPRKMKNGQIIRTGTTARLDIASWKIVDDLIRYGVTPRKTLKAKVSPILENNRDFWRGVIDGNGSLHIAPREGYKSRPVLQLCGSKALLEQFTSFTRQYGTTCNPHKDENVWAIGLTCSPAVNTIRALYQDCCVALPRKLAKAREILNHFG